MKSWSSVSHPGLVSMALFSAGSNHVISLLSCKMWNRPVLLAHVLLQCPPRLCPWSTTLRHVHHSSQYPHFLLFPKPQPLRKWHSAFSFLPSNSIRLQHRSPSRFSIQTAGLAFGGTSLCSYRVRGVGGSCAEHFTVESYTIIISLQSYLLSYLLLLVFHHPLTLSL